MNNRNNRVFVGFYKTYSNIWYIAVLQFLIRLFNFSKYSHAEFFFYEATHGMTFAIGANTFPKPVVTIQQLEMDNSKWDFIELPSYTFDRLLELARDFEGSKYDFIGVLASIIPWLNYYNEEKFFCSEFIAYVMDIAGFHDIIEGDTLVNPGELHRKLHKYFNNNK